MKKTILIVEDESAIRNVLIDKFSSKDFIAIGARNGEEGLEVALDKHPDLILLDVIMPKMDGMTMLSKLREDTWGEKVKVILLTNLNDPEKTLEAMKNGAYDYLVKSDWKIDDVVDKVKERLDLD